MPRVVIAPLYVKKLNACLHTKTRTKNREVFTNAAYIHYCYDKYMIEITYQDGIECTHS